MMHKDITYPCPVFGCPGTMGPCGGNTTVIFSGDERHTVIRFCCDNGEYSHTSWITTGIFSTIPEPRPAVDESSTLFLGEPFLN